MGFGWNVEELEDHGVPGKKRRTVLREYLELMQQLWGKEVASYEGEFAHLKPSWAYPKPVQQPRIPILVGAGGTPKNFDWIVANADGWITTPIETDIEDRVASLNAAWAKGPEGDPRVVVLLTSRLEPGQLERWEALGVDEVMFGLPDKSADEVEKFIARLGASLNRAGGGRVMGTYVVSGSASGIGAAVTARLRADGHTVIGVDLHDAEVTGDLATESGRAAPSPPWRAHRPGRRRRALRRGRRAHRHRPAARGLAELLRGDRAGRPVCGP